MGQAVMVDDLIRQRGEYLEERSSLEARAAEMLRADVDIKGAVRKCESERLRGQLETANIMD
eukprot:492850-Lingulodinium_polyedra.AAC.1